jgi:hypothetical protein
VHLDVVFLPRFVPLQYKSIYQLFSSSKNHWSPGSYLGKKEIFICCVEFATENFSC